MVELGVELAGGHADSLEGRIAIPDLCVDIVTVVASERVFIPLRHYLMIILNQIIIKKGFWGNI